jgi:hypothetical protein
MKTFRAKTFLLAAIFLVAAGLAARAQLLTTLFTNGPTNKCINIVLLSEGYQASELAAGKFTNDAKLIVSNLLSAVPFSEYSNYFNAYLIATNSTDSGSSRSTAHPGVLNTYFNSTYNSSGVAQLVTIPPNSYDSNPANGRGKVTNLLATLMPSYHVIILVVNDTTYGGSGNTPDTAPAIIVTSINFLTFPDTVAHETGHAIAGLADEYVGNGPSGVTLAERPNATTNTIFTNIPWRAWIDTNSTPLPTPATVDYIDSVGLFQGSQYQTNGWYRPKENCKMNNLGYPFCEVCSEALVKSFYRFARPVLSFAPAATNQSLITTQAVAFNFLTLQPNNHALAVQWFTNGVAVPGATGTNYNLSPARFANGTNTVRARILDTTSLVMNDPTNLLSNSVSWTLTVGISDLRLVSPRWLTNGRFAFTVTGTVPQNFSVLASTNFSNWLSLATNALVAGQFNYTNTNANTFPRRFYRTQVLP